MISLRVLVDTDYPLGFGEELVGFGAKQRDGVDKIRGAGGVELFVALGVLVRAPSRMRVLDARGSSFMLPRSMEWVSGGQGLTGGRLEDGLRRMVFFRYDTRFGAGE